MSIQSIQGSTQNTELYQIHKQTESQQAEQAQFEQVTQTDEYDKANPVGEEVEGVYSVAYDDEGGLKVNYTQPGEKSGTQSSGGTVQAASPQESDSEDDSTEEKIEELKRQRNQIKQLLNKEKDEEVKKTLRTQLQAIEAQIAQLTAQQKS